MGRIRENFQANKWLKIEAKLFHIQVFTVYLCTLPSGSTNQSSNRHRLGHLLIDHRVSRSRLAAPQNLGHDLALLVCCAVAKHIVHLLKRLALGFRDEEEGPDGGQDAHDGEEDIGAVPGVLDHDWYDDANDEVAYPHRRRRQRDALCAGAVRKDLSWQRLE